MKLKVLNVFEDKYNKKLYNPGDVIKIEDEDRVEDLVERKLAEVVKAKAPKDETPKGITVFEKDIEKKALIEALKSLGVQATGTMKEETLLAKVAELDEEATGKLKEALGVE